MHLKKVTLNNFRCFKSLEIELHPRLTVFVAENGGGKTAILDGIAIGLTPIMKILSSANQRLSGPGIKDTDFRLERHDSRSGEERWDASDYAQIVVETSDGLRWDHWRPSMKDKRPQEKVGTQQLNREMQNIVDRLWSSDPIPLPVFAYYGARRGWIEIPERLRGSKIDYNHPTAALVETLDSLSNFKEMLKWFDITEANELRMNKGKVVTDFKTDWALDLVRSTVSAILENAYQNPHFNKKNKFVVTPQGKGADLQVSQLSQGYQSMLALAMDFARRLAVATSHLSHDGFEQPDPKPFTDPAHAPAIMMIDEIDLHLHPSWQQKVLGDLMTAFPNTQFIVTTHSPQVLSTVPKESIRMIRRDADEWQLETPEFQPRGVESADVLTSIMDVDPVPEVEEAKWLKDYRNRIEDGTHNTPEGKSLREKLMKHFGEQHPAILDCDRLIRFQEFKLRRTSADNA